MAKSDADGSKSAKKRIRRDPDTTRALILDTAERIIVEEGYASVSSRRVAQDLELNGATIHYYYPTTDDLFIALHARMAQRQLVQVEAALQSDDPLQALWDFQSGWSQSALGVEFLALANHRKAIREVLAKGAEAAREGQIKALEQAVAAVGAPSSIISPAALVTMVVAVARTLTNEERVGITRGHREVREFVAWALSQVERTPTGR